MTAVAVDVGLGVTHLALNFVDVKGVLPYRSMSKIPVAIGASNRLLQSVTTLEILWCGGAHLVGLMTGGAIHARFGGVDVSPTPFPIEFIAHPASMAGGALVERIWALLEYVSVDKSFFCILGPANMAAAAAGVAAGAVVLPRLFDMFPPVHVCPAFEHLWERGQGFVQGIHGCFDDLFVAFTAGLLGIVDGGQGIHFLMGTCFFPAGRITAVAVHTLHFTVVSGQKLFGNEDLFLRLQRSHLAASACARLQGRLLDLHFAEVF
jgi:hypothetical protein